MSKAFDLDLSAYPDPMAESDVAGLLGVPVERLRRWTYTHRGPKTLKIANKRLVRKAALLEWLQSREG